MAKAKINPTMLYIVKSLVNTFFLGFALIKLPYIYNYLFLGEKIACEGPGECFGETLIEVRANGYFDFRDADDRSIIENKYWLNVTEIELD